jgi:hypothetical protein
MRRLAPFDPTQIAGCKLWLDGSDAGSITLSSGSVTQWNDKSGNNNTMTPYSSYSNVTISSAYQNQLNVLNFSGGGLYKAPSSSAVYPLDLYIVVALKDTTTAVDVIGININTSGTDFNSLTFSEYTSSRWHNGSDFFNRTPNTVSPINETSTSFLLINWSIANANYIIRRNGVQLSQTSSYTFTLAAGSIFQIGHRLSTGYSPTPDHPFRGYIAEIVAFNSQLASSQQQQIEGYLAQKWGLKSNLPGGHLGLTSVIYPTLRTLTLIPRAYPSTFSATGIAGSTLWLDASDPAGNGTTPSNGASLSSWTDKSGNGLTVSAASSQPTYTTNAANGLGTVAFNGSQGLTAGSVTGEKLVGNTGGCAIFVVMRVDNSPGRSTPFSWDDGTYTDRLLLHYTENSLILVDKGSLVYFPNNRTVATISLSTSLYYIFSYSQNGANTSLNANGTTIATLTNFANNNIASSSRLFNVGSYVNGSDWNMRGNTAEILFYNTNIPSNFQQVEGYLAWKWGLQSSLPASHPYKSASPNQTNPLNLTRPAQLLNQYPTPKTTGGSRIVNSLISLSSTTDTFSFVTPNGADQSYTVPANVYAVVAYIWGAGGGGSVGGTVGGAGAFAQVILPVTPGQTYTIIVGQGGTQTASGTYGGGGLGYVGNAWAGGGRSAVRYGSADIVTLGAGGGTGQDSGSTGGIANWSPLINGGAGYASTAAQNVSVVSGKGGTQTAGGAGGSAAGGLSSAYNGGAGGLNYGGVGGVSPAPTGGGGSGYYGGGGGGGGPYYCTGGGGGSSLINNVIPITGGNSPNSQDQAPGTSSSFYTGNIATGGTTGAGGNGLVVLTYASCSSIILGVSLSIVTTTATMSWNVSQYVTTYYWALYYNTTNSLTGAVLNNYGSTASTTATATVSTSGYYFFGISGLSSSGGVSQVAYSNISQK